MPRPCSKRKQNAVTCEEEQPSKVFAAQTVENLQEVVSVPLPATKVKLQSQLGSSIHASLSQRKTTVNCQETCVPKIISSPVLQSYLASKNTRLDRIFFNVPCEELARALLGQKIVRMVENVRISAFIVETEAYLGAIDKAAHSYKGQTDRNKAMFMEPGTAYVYTIYGMYCCINISSQGEGAAVLIRSVEPAEGVEKMLELRTSQSSSKKQLQAKDLGNGPSKLCQSLAITKASVNQRDLVTDTNIWLERGFEVPESRVVVSRRVNIAYAEEWTDKPLRFYLLGNEYVSTRDKKAESELSVE